MRRGAGGIAGTLASCAAVLALTLVVGIVVARVPYFGWDVALTRALQAWSARTAWAVATTSLAVMPAKLVVTAVAALVAHRLAGWKGAAVVLGAVGLDLAVTDALKGVIARPRPSPELVAVAGRPTGFGFPSSFTTFITATAGTVLLLAARSPARLAPIAALGAAALIAVGWAARVVLGAHWPSDVVLTTLVGLAWLRVVIGAVDARRR